MAYNSTYSSIMADYINLPADLMPTTLDVLFGDGNSYSDGIYFQSPEGNFFGQLQVIRNLIVPVVWTGDSYLQVASIGAVASVTDLPGVASNFDIWKVFKSNPTSAEVASGQLTDFYYFDIDTGTWNPIVWFYPVQVGSQVPFPGLQIGGAHQVQLKPAWMMWNGYHWVQFPHHSTLDNDEPNIHLPPGFIQYLIPDVELVYNSHSRLTLNAVPGGSGTVDINGQILSAGPSVTVTSDLPALIFDGATLVTQPLANNTQYYVYVANTKSSIFNTSSFDFRGKLFLSSNYPDNNHLWVEGEGLNALVVGQIETNNVLTSAGGPFFRHDLDISWISRRPNILEAFRDYSDYQIVYIGPHEIQLQLTPGEYGMLYVPQSLECLGEGQSILNTDHWVSVDPDSELPVLNTTPLAPNTNYYIYIVNDVNAVNFNAINSDTGMPWTADDFGAQGNYQEHLDLRLVAFLSDKPHENFRLTQTYPLFYSRCLGYIQTDANGLFIYNRDGSYIKSMQVNPVDLKGIADVSIYPINTSSFEIAKKAGTNGVMYVGGSTVYTYSQGSSRNIKPNIGQYAQAYTEHNITSPLSKLNIVSSYKSTVLYVYITNEDSCWGDQALSAIFSFIAPTDGYLSPNYPGSSARWIATIQTDKNGLLTGSWLLDSSADMSAIYASLPGMFNQLSEITNQLSDANALTDFLMGWNSNFNLGLDPIVSNLWSDYSGLSTDIYNISNDYTAIASATSGIVGDVTSLSTTATTMSSNVDTLYGEVSQLYAYNGSFSIEVSGLGAGLNSLNQTVYAIESDITEINTYTSGIENTTNSLGYNLSYLQSNIIGLSVEDHLLETNIAAVSYNLGIASANAQSLSSSVSLMGVELYSLSGTYSNIADNVISLGGDTSNFYSFQGLFNSNLWSLLSDAAAITSLDNQLTSQMSVVQSGFTLLSNLESSIGLYEDSLRTDYSNITGIYSLIQLNVTNIIQDQQELQNLQFWLEIEHSDLLSDYTVISNIQTQLSGNVSGLTSDATNLFETTNNLWNNWSALSNWTNSLSGDQSLIGDNVANLGVLFGSLTIDLSGLGSNINSLNYDTSGSFAGVYSNISNISNDVTNIWSNWSGLSQYTNSLSGVTSELQVITTSLSGNIFSLSGEITNLTSDILFTSGLANSLSIQLNSLSLDINAQSSLLYDVSQVTLSLGSSISSQSLIANSLSLATSQLSNDLLGQSAALTSLSQTTLNLGINLLSLSLIENNLNSTTSNLSNNLLSESNLVSLLSGYTISLSGNVSNLSLNTKSLSTVLSSVGTQYSVTSGLVSSLSGNMSLIGSQYSSTSGVVSLLGSNITNIQSNWSSISNNVSGLSIYTTALSKSTSLLSQNALLASLQISGLNNNYIALSNTYIGVSGTASNLQSTLNLVSGNVNTVNGLVTNLSLWATSLQNGANALSNNLLTAQNNLNGLGGDVTSLSNAISNLENGLNSGYIGTIPILITYDWIGKRFAFADQKDAGLPIRLDYNGGNAHLAVWPTQPGTQIVFPNAGVFNLNYGMDIDITQNIWGTLTPGSLYYVLLRNPDGGVYTFNGGGLPQQNFLIGEINWCNSSASVKKYTQLATLNSDCIVIGYVTVSSNNYIQDTYNLWSIYNQPQQSWSVGMNNASTVVLNTPGLIRPTTDCNLILNRTGTTQVSVTDPNGYSYVTCYSPSILLGSTSVSMLFWSEISNDGLNTYSYYGCCMPCNPTLNTTGSFGTIETITAGLNINFHSIDTTSLLFSSFAIDQIATGGSVCNASGALTLIREAPHWPLIL